ncbi:unnamed protein product [Parnassius apollo]|uniref:(apollo) hypothetical protein n=1 Tax=Parnassius apollo TaxID=110799 RepID=A0A8S3X4P2_PARAO|nr:unnamed protein product [Parnassius apollo]
MTSSFRNKDERPLIVCFICHAKLKRCRRLQQQAIESNAVLEQLLAGGSTSIPKPHDARDEIKFTPVYQVDIWPVECDMKNDCQDKNFNLESVKVEEDNLENKNSKFEENGNLQTVTDGKAEDLEIDAFGDIQMDSEDDLPLIAISSKKKQKSKAVKFKKKRKNNKKDDNDIDIEAIANEIILTVEEQRQEILDRASSENYLNAMYKCEKCYKGFVHPRAFSNHMNRHDQHQMDIAHIQQTIADDIYGNVVECCL